MRLGYLTSKYPAVSHTFVQREIAALRALGLEIETFSVWAAEDAEVLTDDDRRERDATYALLPPNAGDVLLAHVRAGLSRPRAYARAFRQALALSAAGIRGRLLGLLWFSEAVVLWRECLRRDIRHLHVHINGTAPAVALVTTVLGNGGRPAGDWSWSFTAHGPSEFYDAWRERLGDKVEHAAFVVCISDFARSQVLTFAEHRWWDKVHVVHCGVDLGVFSPDGDARGGAAANGDRPAEILSVGRLVPFKGQAVLVRAIAELAGRGVAVHATVVGDGPARGALESLARELGVDGHITFAGAVGQDVIRRYYRQADVFCMSSFAEGIPVVLMEAMAMEVPAVAPRIMGIPELIDHGSDGLLVPPGRHDALADALAELLESPARREAIGRAARAKIEAEFDLHSSAEQLKRLFDERHAGR
jgi:glycosyltransferase involved in cell wall biosynthesis